MQYIYEYITIDPPIFWKLQPNVFRLLAQIEIIIFDGEDYSIGSMIPIILNMNITRFNSNHNNFIN